MTGEVTLEFCWKDKEFLFFFIGWLVGEWVSGGGKGIVSRMKQVSHM